MNVSIITALLFSLFHIGNGLNVGKLYIINARARAFHKKNQPYFSERQQKCVYLKSMFKNSCPSDIPLNYKTIYQSSPIQEFHTYFRHDCLDYYNDTEVSKFVLFILKAFSFSFGMYFYVYLMNNL